MTHDTYTIDCNRIQSTVFDICCDVGFYKDFHYNNIQFSLFMTASLLAQE